MEIEEVTFTPLVFTTTGGMSEECQHYYCCLTKLPAVKKQESYASTIAWIRTNYFFIYFEVRNSLPARFILIEKKVTPNIQETDLEAEVSIAFR